MRCRLIRVLVVCASVFFLGKSVAADTYYVTDYGITENQGYLSKVVNGVVSTFVNNLDHPEGIVADGQGNLYVALQDGDAIDKITPAGNVSQFASLPLYLGGMAMDNSGDLYVSLQTQGVIDKISPAGGVSTFATLGASTSPQGLAFDSSGNLYAAEDGANAVQKITPGGVVTTYAAGLDSPVGVAIDGSGNVYVSNSGDDTVDKIVSPGNFSVFASLPDGPYNTVWGMTFNSQGVLLVADIDGNAIYSLNPDGSSGPTITGNFYGPGYIVVPEPALGLIGTAMLMLGRRRHRRL